MPELPNFEEKKSNIKVICEVIQIGMKKPKFTKIGCVNCEV